MTASEGATGNCSAAERGLHFRAVVKNAPYESAGAALRNSSSRWVEGLAGARKVKVQCPTPSQVAYNISSCPTQDQYNFSSFGQTLAPHPWDSFVYYTFNGTRWNVSCNDSSMIGPNTVRRIARHFSGCHRRTIHPTSQRRTGRPT